MQLYTDFPRLNLGFFPTPLVYLKNLTHYLDGPAIYMKRDDCTGLATGGNKTRKLEFLLAQALQNGCDRIITAGALQSNHVRQTAAAAAKLGLICELVLSESKYRDNILYKNNGNLLLDQILGANIHFVEVDSDLTLEMNAISERLKEGGHNPYIIPVGGSNEIGALGYIAATEELYHQCREQKIAATHLIVATSSGGTQAGLQIGKFLKNWDLQIFGITVGIKNPTAKKRVDMVIESTCKFLNINHTFLTDIDGDYEGIDYGQPTTDAINAIKLVAQMEGIILDPVYTGIAMSALIDYIKKGRFSSKDVLIFLHTGGNTAIHAYADRF